MGIEKERFIDQNRIEDFICCICHDVFYEPKQEPNDGLHAFCDSCIKGWLKTNQTCPECRTPFNPNDLQNLNRRELNMLKRLMIKCKYHKLGCQHISDLETIEKHELNDCEFRPKPCPKCVKLIEYSNEHRTNDCIDTLLKTIQAKDDDILNKDKTIENLNNQIILLRDELKMKNKEIANKDNKNEPAKGFVDIPEILDSCDGNKILGIKALILNRNANVNYKDTFGNTALMKASELGNIETVKLLIDHGADVNYKNNISYSAFTYAFEASRMGIAKLLIENGANANDRTKTGETALIKATRNNDINMIKLLAKHGANLNFSQDEDTALLIASRKGFLEIVKILVENKADINIRGRNNTTALIEGVEFPEIVKMLILNKAQLNHSKKDGETALLKASNLGILESVRLLVENKADLECSYNNGYTALLNASWSGNLEIVKLLIEHKADVNKKSCFYGSALDIAEKHSKNGNLISYLKLQTNKQQ